MAKQLPNLKTSDFCLYKLVVKRWRAREIGASEKKLNNMFFFSYSTGEISKETMKNIYVIGWLVSGKVTFFVFTKFQKNYYCL